jgi:hypothetical protein
MLDHGFVALALDEIFGKLAPFSKQFRVGLPFAVAWLRRPLFVLLVWKK